MNPEGGRPTDGDEEVLVVQRRSRRLPMILLAALALVALTFLVVHETGKPSAAPTRPAPTSSAPAGTTPPITQRTTFVPRSPVAVIDLRRPLLPAAGDSELFGRGPGVVVRMQLARGRITITTVPSLQSSGPVSFVVGKDEAIVRPLDFVPGYAVPDGQPARQIPGSLGLGQSGPALPGPDPDHIWVESLNSNPPALGLMSLVGGPVGPVLPMPRDGSPVGAVPDGAGYALFTDAAGTTYDSRPDGLRRITTGTVLAVGSTRWLVRECGPPGACKLVVIVQATGARHVLRTPIPRSDATAGVIAPDGTTAAFFVSPSPVLEIVDLRTGAQHVVPIPIDLDTVDARQSLVWSPDNRWLFAVDATGQVRVIDPKTRRITGLATPGLQLPSLSQIATR